jgi:hypothetical protein
MAKTTKPMAQEAIKKAEDNSRPIFAFGKENYILILLGVGLIVLGFILMTGGGSKDPTVFNEEMYDFRRITLAPIMILVGFGIELVAIMRKPRD